MSQATSLTSPILGWRTDLPEDNMPPGSALIMDNVISDGANVLSRGGYEEYSDTGTALFVDALMSYTWGTVATLLAASGGDIWDITIPASPASVGTGFVSDQWQWTQHNNFTIMVNGVDSGQTWNGSVLAPWVPTGVASADLINLGVYKERLYAIEKDSLTFWYGAPQAVTGTFTAFPLDSIANRGGTLVTIGTYSSDTGSGPDDYICFFTSNGEMIIYTGLDPSNPSSWSLIGVWTLSRPIGLRCYAKPKSSNGVIITEHGYVLINEIIAGTPNNQRRGRPVENAVVAAHSVFEASFGWEVVDYSHGNYVAFNVPDGVGGAQFVQHVFQGAGTWQRFTNQNARTWIEWQDQLFFGGIDGIVYKADTGFADNDDNLLWDVKTAYDYFGARARLKRFQMVRPTYRSIGSLPISVDFDVDFEDQAPAYNASPATSTSTPWGSPWGSPWGEPVKLTKDWLDVRGEGYAGALRLRGSTVAQPFQWYSWEVNFQVGGII